MTGDDASRQPPVRWYGGMAYEYGKDAFDDDYKEFPPPGRGTVIESTGNGYTIMPMTETKWDDGDDDASLPVDDDFFACIAAAMAAEQQRGTSAAAVEHGATEAGSAADRPPRVLCESGTVADGCGEDYDDGTDAAPQLVRLGSGSPNQYVPTEYGNDDNKMFSPPPGPGTVIESAGDGYTIVPMTVTLDDGDGEDEPPVEDDFFACIAAAMAAEQQRGTPMAELEHGATEAGSAASRPQPMRCYGSTVAYGHGEANVDGTDGAPQLVGRSGSGMQNQYVYDEYDSDDYIVFPSPGPGTVIKSTGHGHKIVPMTRGDEDLFATAAEQQQKIPVAAAPAKEDGTDVVVRAKEGVVVAAAPGGACAGVEVDDEEERERKFNYGLYNAKDDLAEKGTTTATNINEASPSACVAAAAQRGFWLTGRAFREAVARFNVRRLVRRGGGRKHRNTSS